MQSRTILIVMNKWLEEPAVHYRSLARPGYG